MKKILAFLLTVVLIISLVACATVKNQNEFENKAEEVKKDETAEIKKVINDYFEAVGGREYEKALLCVTEEYAKEFLPESPQEMIRRGYNFNVEAGIWSEKYIEDYIEMSKNHGKDWNKYRQISIDEIEIENDIAKVYIRHTEATVDYGQLYSSKGMQGYKDDLFQKVCGMNENEAFSTLTLDEYTVVCFKVDELEHEDSLKCYKLETTEGVVELKKINNKWCISRMDFNISGN